MTKTITKKELNKVLDSLYILEYYDEENVNNCPENALSETINYIEDNLPAGISFQTKLIGNKYYDTVGKYLAEDYDAGKILCISWNRDYLS